MQILTQFDNKCLEKTIEIAKETFAAGNYPVGAVLAINEELIDTAGNEINQKKSFTCHAENSLILNNGQKLFEAYQQGKIITLYSTLEPCIQCLGAAVTNHINRIIYIEKDPNGGACDLKHDNIGLWYQECWPEIIHAPVSSEPRDMMIKFFHQEIKKGNLTWPQKMLRLLKAN